MSFAPGDFYRISFPVKAEQVTSENMVEIAQWCGGRILIAGETHAGKVVKDTHILVRVHNPQNRNHNKAFIGDWVVESASMFKVYPKNAFVSNFSPMNKNKFEEVLRLVRDAMRWQEEAMYHGNTHTIDPYARKISNQILTLL